MGRGRIHARVKAGQGKAFHLLVCGESAGKTMTAIQEELVGMVGICPLHVGSGSNSSMSRSLYDLLGSSPGNLPISPKIEKGPFKFA